MLRILKYSLLALGMTSLLLGCGYKAPLEVKQELETALPVGTSKEDVVAYLSEHQFEHSADYKPELYYDKNKEIQAVAPGRQYGVLVVVRVYVTLRFDDKDHLIKIETREVKTGL